MQTQKMSLGNIKGKLSRAELKNIMAGSLACGKKGEKCPAPGAQYDGCCDKCNLVLSGTSYCN